MDQEDDKSVDEELGVKMVSEVKTVQGKTVQEEIVKNIKETFISMDICANNKSKEITL